MSSADPVAPLVVVAAPPVAVGELRIVGVFAHYRGARAPTAPARAAPVVSTESARPRAEEARWRGAECTL